MVVGRREGAGGSRKLPCLVAGVFCLEVDNKKGAAQRGRPCRCSLRCGASRAFFESRERRSLQKMVVPAAPGPDLASKVRTGPIAPQREKFAVRVGESHGLPL
jgi:hypothetical protein